MCDQKFVLQIIIVKQTKKHNTFLGCELGVWMMDKDNKKKKKKSFLMVWHPSDEMDKQKPSQIL